MPTPGTRREPVVPLLSCRASTASAAHHGPRLVAQHLHFAVRVMIAENRGSLR